MVRVFLYLTCNHCDSMWNWDGEAVPPEMTCPFSRDCGTKGKLRIDETVSETPDLVTYRATLV